MAVRVGDKVFSPVTNFGRRSAGGPRGAVEGGGGGAGLGSYVTVYLQGLQEAACTLPSACSRPCPAG